MSYCSDGTCRRYAPHSCYPATDRKRNHGSHQSKRAERISLKVSSNMDSRTILDVGRRVKSSLAEAICCFPPVGAPKPIRVQGCYASDEEIEGVTSYIKKSHKANYNAEVEETIKKIAAEEIGKKKKGEEGGDEALDVDSKMDEAIKCVIDAGQASTSLLQRRLSVGYARAGRMIDDMERMGIIGPHQAQSRVTF